jgi:hypothetical protein
MHGTGAVAMVELLTGADGRPSGNYVERLLEVAGAEGQKALILLPDFGQLNCRSSEKPF